jgi:hypothetical protein
MSDTPETDSHPLWHGEPAVHIDFARKLERERDEARIQVKLLKVENNHNWQAMDIANEVTRERDQWRECAQEALLPLAAIKISNQHEPFSEIAPELMDAIIAAHDLIFDRLKETNE